ncbi:hypothetical protein L7F22_038080 [Adiantum nelumboides]|nr:hypothetical protein [Adiantum nelumboides]
MEDKLSGHIKDNKKIMDMGINTILIRLSKMEKDMEAWQKEKVEWEKDRAKWEEEKISMQTQLATMQEGIMEYSSLGEVFLMEDFNGRTQSRQCVTYDFEDLELLHPLDEAGVEWTLADTIVPAPFGKHLLRESTAFYVASPPEDKLPKDPLIGTLLLGKITYGKTQLHSGKDEKNGQLCPASYPLTCLVPPTAKSEEKQKEKDAGKKTLVQCYEEQVRDAKIKALSNLTRGSAEERKEWNDLASALKLEFPKDLKLLHEILIKLSATQKEEDGKDDVDEVIDAADQLLDVIDKEALAKFYGMNSVAEEPEAMKVDQEMEKQHDALVDALYKKGLALAKLEDDSIVDELKGGDSAQEKAELPSSTEIPVEGGTQGSPAACDDRFEETYLELRKWVDISSTKYSLLKVIHEKRAGRFGTALKVLNELLQEDGKAPKRSLYELQVSLLEKVGWVHWAALAKKTLLVCFPPNYPLF